MRLFANMSIDINMNIDIQVIINMEIENSIIIYVLSITHWLFPIGYPPLAIPYCLFPIGY